MLYDRSYDLGKIFDNFIEFGGFDGENITLISSAIADDAAALRTHSGVLRELAQIAFGAKKFKVEKKQKQDGNNTKILQRPHRRAEAAVC